MNLCTGVRSFAASKNDTNLKATSFISPGKLATLERNIVANSEKIKDIDKVNLKVDQLEVSIDDNLEKIQAWIDKNGKYLHNRLTRRGWQNIPIEMRLAPHLKIE